MSTKKPHLRTTKTGKVVKVAVKEGEPTPSLTYNKPKEQKQSSLIFKPDKVKKSDA